MRAAERGTPPAGEPGDPPPARDRRSERSRRSVLDAALELLQDKGVGGFSVDEVARRSGVAKTTIYRHWSTREELVLDACAELDAAQQVPDTGTMVGDLRAYLTGLAALLQRAAWAAVLPSIVDAAERDTEFAAVHAGIQRGHAAPIRRIVDRAIARGDLPGDTDPSVVAAAALGPLFYRRWFSREPLDDAFVDAVVQRITGQRPAGHQPVRPTRPTRPARRTRGS